MLLHKRHSTETSGWGWQVYFICSPLFSQCCRDKLFWIRLGDDKTLFAYGSGSHPQAQLRRPRLPMCPGPHCLATELAPLGICLLELQMSGGSQSWPSFAMILPIHKAAKAFPESYRVKNDLILEPIIFRGSWCVWHGSRQPVCISLSNLSSNTMSRSLLVLIPHWGNQARLRKCLRWLTTLVQSPQFNSLHCRKQAWSHEPEIPAHRRIWRLWPAWGTRVRPFNTS